MIPSSSPTLSLHPEVQTSLHVWARAAWDLIKCSNNSIESRTRTFPEACDVLNELMTGTLVGYLFNRIRKGSVERVHENPSMYNQLDNLVQFVEALKLYGIETEFIPQHIIMGKSRNEFVRTIVAFAEFAKQNDSDMPPPPIIAVSEIFIPKPIENNQDNESKQLGLDCSGVTLLSARLSALEEQQQQLVNTVSNVEQLMLQGQNVINQFASGMLDLFYDVQCLRSGRMVGSDSVDSTRSTFNIAHAAETFPSDTTLIIPDNDAEPRSEPMPNLQPYLSEFELPVANGTLCRTTPFNPPTHPSAHEVPQTVLTRLPDSSPRPCKYSPASNRQSLVASVCGPIQEDPLVCATIPLNPSTPPSAHDVPQAVLKRLPATCPRPCKYSPSPNRQSFISTICGPIQEDTPVTCLDDAISSYILQKQQSLFRDNRSSIIDKYDVGSGYTTATKFYSNGRRDSSDISALKEQLSCRLPLGVLNECSTRIELMRQSAIYELIETERDFVRDLMVIIDVVKPWLAFRLKDYVGSSCNLPDSEMFFGNIDMISQSHLKILDVMNQHIDTHVVIEPIEDIVNEMIPLLKHHIQYATHYSTSVSPILHQSNFIPISNEVGTLPETNNQSLASLLIKPIQRISKYPLLLNEIKKYSFENCPGFRRLETGISNLHHLLEQVNSNSAPPCQGFNTQLVSYSKSVAGFSDLNLPSITEFVREGPALRWMNGKMSKVHWILFVDALIVCKSATSRSYRKKYDIAQVFNPAKLIVVPVPAISGHANTCAVDIFPIGEKHQGLPDSFSSISAAVEWVSSTATGADKMQPTSCTFAFEVTEDRSAWIRALDKAMGLQIKRGTSGPLRRKSKGRRPWSFLSENKGSSKGSELGRANIPKHSGLPPSSVSPHDLPDNMELLVRTLDRHSPSSRYEIGFEKHTFLRVVNCDQDKWKVSMSQIVGLVSKSLVVGVDVEPCRYTQLLQACRTEKVMAWIDAPLDCIVIPEQPTAIANVMRSSISVGNGMNTLTCPNLPMKRNQTHQDMGDHAFVLEESKCQIPAITRYRKASAPVSIKKHKSGRRDSHKGMRFVSRNHSSVSDVQFNMRPVIDAVEGREEWIKVTRDNHPPYFYHRPTGRSLWSIPEPGKLIS